MRYPELHTFRHSFISNALCNRTPEAIVRNWVGQIDPETIKLYTHVLDPSSQDAMRRLTEANHARVAQPGKEVSDDRMDGPR